jgi:hypothetical protein
MICRFTFFPLIVAITAISLSEAHAQGRRHEGGKRDRWEKKEKRNRDDRFDDECDHRHSASRNVHYHHHECRHETVVTYHQMPSRPRYIYYRDYDVYYDYHNSVYISLSRRGWTVSKVVPVSMTYVDLRRAKRYEVQYHDDDFVTYLDRRGRPHYGRECEW